jgi:hypothetical protein
VVAFESLVKLVAFLLAGLFVAYGIFGGYGNILSQMVDQAKNNPAYADLIDVEYPLWFSLTLISFFAILFLPRQFHVMVVENCDEKHLKKAMWLFPLYLLLINLFVPAIAWGGLLLNTGGLKDAFIITIPYTHNQDLLSLFVFIGGTSAATAMILVESVAVGTMLLNDLELPYILSHIKKAKKSCRYSPQHKEAEHTPGGAPGVSLLARCKLPDPGRYWHRLFFGRQSAGTCRFGWPVLEERQPARCHGRAGIGLPAVDLHRPHSYSRWKRWCAGKFGQGWTLRHCLPQAH